MTTKTDIIPLSELLNLLDALLNVDTMMPVALTKREAKSIYEYLWQYSDLQENDYDQDL